MVIGTEIEIIKQISIALLMGFGFGLVQELRGSEGAMRMYSLLTAGVSLFTVLGFVLLESFGSNYNYLVWSVDPALILLGLFVGVGVAGAGYAINNKESGLNGVSVFASMIIMSTVGVCIALQRIYLALIVTLMAIVATELAFLVEKKFLINYLTKKKKVATKKKPKKSMFA